MSLLSRGAACAGVFALGSVGVLASPLSVPAALAAPGSIELSEIVYNNDVPDSIEIHNTGTEPVDLTGWSLHDDQDRTGLGELTGTIEPGEYRVFTKLEDDGTGDFDFGLGKADSVVLRDADGAVVDEFSWENTAPLGTWARCGADSEWAHATAITLGAENDCTPAPVEPTSGSIVINEIDSGPSDWIEFYNAGDEPLDISGYEIRDNSDDHRWQFPAGSMIQPGEYLVVDAKSEGLIYNQSTNALEPNTFEAAIGIGSGDSIRLYDREGGLLDAYSWTGGHAQIDGDAALATLGRVPDGVGTFGLTHPTAGAANEIALPGVVINEVESNGDATDWVEVMNVSSTPVDISGWTVMDNDPMGHAADVIPVPAGTVLEPDELYVFDGGTHFGFGLGGGDTATVRNMDGATVDEYTWSSHATGTYGRCPDGTGELMDLPISTKDALNACDPSTLPEEEELPTTEWPGSPDPSMLDTEPMFLSDSSGLDADGSSLWAVDNGEGMFWKLEVQADGTVRFADGWEDGKRARYMRDADNPDAAGPDTEGITMASDGFLYLASERDNSDKGVNENTILQIDPNAPGPDVVASMEWDLTQVLPQVSANTGIESVEFVDGGQLDGTFTDLTTGAPFSISDYPEAQSGGVFFTALEANGHVYGFVLQPDGSAIMVADFDPGIGGAMGLDYLEEHQVLVVVADDGFNGVSASIDLSGASARDGGALEPAITLYERPAGMPNVNNEGFALQPTCTDGVRLAFYFEDGVTQGALRSVELPCDAFAPAAAPVDEEEPGGEDDTETGTDSGDDTGTDTGTGDGDGSTGGRGEVPGATTPPAVDAGSDGASGSGSAGSGSSKANTSASSGHSGMLPRTGADVAGLVGLAALSLVAGGLALRASRRAS